MELSATVTARCFLAFISKAEVDFGKPLAGDLSVETFVCNLTTRLAHASLFFRTFYHPPKSVGKSLRIIRGNQETIDAMLYGLRDTANPRSHYG